MVLSSDIIMPFGKYQGQQLMNIPRDYLEWLLEQSWFEEKYKKYKKYVEHQLERRDRSYDTF